MKKLSKKSLGVILVSCILASSFASCSSSEKDTKKDLGDSFNKEGYPIVKEEVTLDVLTTRWGSMGDTFTNNQFLKDLEEKTNVKIEWQVQSTNDWGEQKSIMLASGTLPSVIFGSETFKDADIVNNLESFVAFDDYLEYMPNLSAILEKDSKIKQLSTFPDGKLYSMAARYPSRPWTTQQPVINQVWLDNLGLEQPKTMDDLYNVLKAFKEKDANGNGDSNDEIPYTAKGFVGDWLTLFGLNDHSGDNMGMLDGEPVFIPSTENYKECMKFMQKLYKEGLIDQELFTQDDTMTNAKYENPDIPIVGFTFQWTPDATFNKWKDQYTTIGTLEGYNGVKTAKGEKGGYSYAKNQVEITKFCEYPEVAARWIDEFYTDEAGIQNFWGAIGTVIQKNEDDTYELMDPPEGTSADAWYWEQSLRDFGPKYVSEEFESKIKLSSESGDGLKLELDKLGKDYVGDSFPKVVYTEEEYKQLPTLTTDIDKYVETTRAKWITDSSIDIDKEWDGYIKKLNDMGLEDLMKIRLEAYERYMEIE